MTEIPEIRPSMGLREWMMLLALSILWGGSFLFNAVAVRELPVFLIVWMRVGLAAICLWTIVAALRLRLPALGEWRRLLVIGCLNNALPFSLIVWGQTQVAAGLASILNATTPIFTVVIAHFATRDERLNVAKAIGVICGFAGVAVMMGINTLQPIGTGILHQLALLGAAISYGMAAVFGRKLSNIPPLVTAAGQTTASCLVLTPVMMLVSSPWTVHAGVLAWLSVLGLAVLCTALAYLLFFSILRSAGAGNVSIVTLLVPVSAVLLGVFLLGEEFLPRHMIGMAATATAILMIDDRAWRFIQRFRA